MSKLYGAVEAGGTKFVCAVGTGPEQLELARIPTTTPEETLQAVEGFFRPYEDLLAAIGIGCFGPIDVHLTSETYGFITKTPKQGWSNVDIAGYFAKAFNVPVGFDTDVNAAALGEFMWGHGKGLSDFIYLTLGTGIGGGVISGGQLVHGLLHPELGHIPLPKHPDDTYSGGCPFHGDLCFEGLASGPALEARWHMKGEEIHTGHEAWELEAHYVALALMSYICTFSPQKIILGGGVMSHARLLDKIRDKTSAFLNQYVQQPRIINGINGYIVGPALLGQSGIVGALELARRSELKHRL